MSCSKQEAENLLRSEGYMLWPPETLETKQQCFVCSQWQSVKVMKPANLSGLTELLCITCWNKLQAREDTLELEIERSDYAKPQEHPDESTALSETEES